MLSLSSSKVLALALALLLSNAACAPLKDVLGSPRQQPHELHVPRAAPIVVPVKPEVAKKAPEQDLSGMRDLVDKMIQTTKDCAQAIDEKKKPCGKHDVK